VAGSITPEETTKVPGCALDPCGHSTASAINVATPTSASSAAIHGPARVASTMR
jgi:hypothetical protein